MSAISFESVDAPEDALRRKVAERLRQYLAALGLPEDESTSLVERATGDMPAEPEAAYERAFERLHRLLAERDGGPAAGLAASRRKRVTTRFGRLPWSGRWPRLRSMPPIRRGHMRPPPLDRSPLRRLMDGVLWLARLPTRLAGPDRLRSAARLRQLALSVLVALPAFAGSGYLAAVLPHQGGTGLEVAILAVAFLLFAWILVGFWTAVAGFRTLLFGDRYAVDAAVAGRTPLPAGARTAVVMPICDEDVDRVFAGLRTVYRSLADTGQAERFDFFVLSDSRDPDLWVEEEVAWAAMCRDLGAHGRVYYRRRRTHAKRKNGNIADFCRRWGGQYRYMVVLDADSIMTGDALVRLAQLMEHHPAAGLIQTQPFAVERHTPIARIQQFALRAYGPLFAAGLHFWHLDNAHYWGHNAIIRIAPFMAHCSLPRLPGKGALSGDILSHDFVEAALLRRAGWGVYLAYDLPGSYEEMPPTLLDELKRDRRWCQGNLQHMRLLFSDRLNPAHRALFANGVMAYASALLWLVFLGLSSTEAVLEALRPHDYFPEAGGLFPEWPVWRPAWAISLFAATLVVLFLPKLLGLLRILWRGEARDFGGWPGLLASTVLEILFTTLIAPVRMLSHSRFVAVTLLGGKVRWGAQSRSDVGIPWTRALRYHGPGMLIALAWGGLLFYVAPGFAPWLLPIFVPLLLAPAVTVYSSRPGLGRRLRRRRLFLIPEESRPPRVLRRLRRELRRGGHEGRRGFARALLDPAVNALHCALVRSPHTLPANERERRRALCDRVLEAGPESLGSAERAALLDDAVAFEALHERLWASPRWPWPAMPPAQGRDGP
ncbi:glucosyltransferase MdoH [Salinisphaera sp. PC39]|uniref:glucans biosynthesis glucosyltransferase MdoH n=1 Tax=Salinisphaera sp. PC39 TaxID=1304156 RepID=UPI00333F88A0